MDLVYLILIILCTTALFHLRNGAIYVPTDKKTVQDIINILDIRPGMKIADLGSGDGRIVVALAQAGAVATGFENNPVLFVWSWLKAKKPGQGRAQIRFQSFWHQDLGEFDAIVVFGMTHIMERLSKKLQKELKPGGVVVSNIFELPNWPVSARTGNLRIYRR